MSPSRFRIEKLTSGEVPLEGAAVIAPRIHRDPRGALAEVWRDTDCRELGLGHRFVQENVSFSRRGVLRGLHWQGPPTPMGKLVRCDHGHILDVVVDLRASSPTFGRWAGIPLRDREMRQVWVPVGFAHGFCVLSEEAVVVYRCTAYHDPRGEGALAWDDPELAIHWPVRDPVLSARDRNARSWRRYCEEPVFR